MMDNIKPVLEIGYKLLTPTAKPPEFSFTDSNDTMCVDVFTDASFYLRALGSDLDRNSCNIVWERDTATLKDGPCECHPHNSILPYANISTGLALQLPKGVHITWASRSGLAFKNGRVAVEGKIDRNYRGEIKLKLWSMNPDDNGLYIPAGTKIAQLEIVEYPSLYTFKEVSDLEDSSRGTKGFGSTGL